MFCPQCGSTQSDELKYCKSCGSNLQALRQIMATRDVDDSFDWSKTWAAEMFLTNAEKDRRRGITPEMKRRREIKAGVITASAGLGLMIFLIALMGGIIAGGRVSDTAAEILSRIWVVGVIPILVGAALIINGVFVSPREDERESEKRTIHETAGTDTSALEPPASGGYLSPGTSDELTSGVPFSVTDRTTRHLQKEPRRKQS